MDLDALLHTIAMRKSLAQSELELVRASYTPSDSGSDSEAGHESERLELTLFEWFLRWEKSNRDNKDKIRRAFKSQLLSGILQSGGSMIGYSSFVNRKKTITSKFGKRPYKEIKMELFPKIQSKRPYKDMFGALRWNVWNYYLTGESINSISKAGYQIHSLQRIMFDRSATLFDNKKSRGRVLIPVSEFGLNERSINYLVEKYVKPFIIKENGIIKQDKAKVQRNDRKSNPPF